MLVGTSPPFEIAVLMYASIVNKGDAKVSGLVLGGAGRARLVTYASDATKGHQVIRTAYNEA